MSSFPRFNSLRKKFRAGFAAVALAALAACDTAGFGPIVSGSPLAGGGGEVDVALLVPSGSGDGGDAVLARSLENAARLAIADLDGANVNLSVYSTAGNADVAATAAVQAVNDGAQIILGPVYAGAANAAGVAVAGQGVNVLAFSNNPSIAGGNVFILGPTFANTADRLMRYAASAGKRRIVVVHANDVAGSLGRDAIASAAARSAASVVSTVSYPLSQQGVVQTVPSIVSAVRQNAADAIFLTSSTASALPLLTQLLPEAGLDPAVTQYIGLTRWDIPPQTLDLPGVQGGWFALPDQARTAAFANRYRAAYGDSPHPIAGLAFDGIAAIGALAARDGRRIGTAQLTQGAGFQGASGIFRLRPDGTNERGLAVATIRNRQVVILSPAPQAFGGAGF